MTGQNDPGFWKMAAVQTFRKRAEEKVAACDNLFSDLSVSGVSALIQESRIHQVGGMHRRLKREIIFE